MVSSMGYSSVNQFRARGLIGVRALDTCSDWHSGFVYMFLFGRRVFGTGFDWRTGLCKGLKHEIFVGARVTEMVLFTARGPWQENLSA